jgi:hypothetical protein
MKKKPVQKTDPWIPGQPEPGTGPIKCAHKYVNGVCVHCGAKEPNK